MYCIAGFKKVKENAKFSQMSNHNFRLHLTEGEAKRIDSSRSHLNQILWNPLQVDTTKSTDLKEKIYKHWKENDTKIKSDSVLAIDIVLTASPEFFQDANGEPWHKNGKIRPECKNKIDDWVATQMDFMKNLFGEPAIKMAVLHLDETTPHIHIVLTSEQTKVLKYKNQFGEFSKTTTSLNADRWNPTFWKKFLTVYEKANKKFGLKKGEEDSMSENVPIKEFSALISRASQEDYTKAIEKIIDDLKGDLSGFNTKEGVKKLLMEKLLPTLNPMLKSNKALKKVIALDRGKEYSQIKKMKEDLARALESAEALRKHNEAVKAEYVEAINSKGGDGKKIFSITEKMLALEDTNKSLLEENKRLKDRYEPKKSTNNKNTKGDKNGLSI
ncbi:plasmid recombination protein [Burkholderia multivorans]|uniref:plasmid recombination protein n=1 Tax=Burkholderia multivorans TaxID=87883 RepID=UPI000D00790D|nr:plasmid recombination protein [Burkholderia multivorans]MCA8484848.1 plasmid recombination protein [Burkholderia multivorans]MDN7447364.1 plasmid recombination protein [Burkholderia multivorans]MDN7998707.1 plasmid recombination protein [Burkholderia multivorans]PRG16969.1 hypothetical protein C6T62_29715 [Burkholderia multivorans]